MTPEQRARWREDAGALPYPGAPDDRDRILALLDALDAVEALADEWFHDVDTHRPLPAPVEMWLALRNALAGVRAES